MFGATGHDGYGSDNRIEILGVQTRLPLSGPPLWISISPSCCEVPCIFQVPAIKGRIKSLPNRLRKGVGMLANRDAVQAASRPFLSCQ
jgi:hypothetical protein